MITATQQTKNAIKWLEALKGNSGFKKTTEKLAETDIEGTPLAYCCLGVGCKITKITPDDWSDGSESALVEKLGLFNEDGGFFEVTAADDEGEEFIDGCEVKVKNEKGNFYPDNLATLNDDVFPDDKNFKNIRAFILKNLDKVFQPKVAKKLKEHFKKKK
jgi:hypothetical protein